MAKKKLKPCSCAICKTVFLRRKGSRCCSVACRREQGRISQIKQREKERLRAAGLLPSKPAKKNTWANVVIVRRGSSVKVVQREPKLKPYVSKWKDREEFYQSREWRELRFKAFVIHGRKCLCCGAAPPAVVLHVDHVKPRFTHPELELELSNLQVLCADCNLGKSAKFDTDFR